MLILGGVPETLAYASYFTCVQERLPHTARLCSMLCSSHCSMPPTYSAWLPPRCMLTGRWP